MKLLIHSLLALTLTLGLVSQVSAQTVATTTTLAANMSATDTIATVTSATGFTVGNQMWIDFEQMSITAVSGTAITVRRGVNGTAARAHDNTERIITGVAAHFHTNDPDDGADVVRGVGQGAYSPWINVRTGVVWVPNPFQTGRWAATSVQKIAFDSIPTTF